MGELSTGRIMDIREDGKALILADIPDVDRAMYRRYGQVLIEYDDGRRISAQQRKKAYVLIHHISEWSGYAPDEVTKEITKMMFRYTQDTLHDEMFSLSDCDITTARLYIDYLIAFCIDNNIDVGQPMYELCEDIGRYVYWRLLNKQCCICGKKADLHHVQTVGAGRNRKEICHIGMAVLPLCRSHHTEAHTIGQRSFLQRYHLQTVKVDKRIADLYHLGKKEGRKDNGRTKDVCEEHH